mmetsp:Transcript_35680/g.78143  ORF Transcript_35680/g.78143 Transcript_35680/m.78143 type:complete len:250 (-) Transcript_35680:223-972(-)
MPIPLLINFVRARYTADLSAHRDICPDRERMVLLVLHQRLASKRVNEVHGCLRRVLHKAREDLDCDAVPASAVDEALPPVRVDRHKASVGIFHSAIVPEEGRSRSRAVVGNLEEGLYSGSMIQALCEEVQAAWWESSVLHSDIQGEFVSPVARLQELPERGRAILSKQFHEADVAELRSEMHGRIAVLVGGLQASPVLNEAFGAPETPKPDCVVDGPVVRDAIEHGLCVGISSTLEKQLHRAEVPCTSR